jgi:hypothetical protein
MKVIAETPNVRLVCDGKKHRAEDKRTGLLVLIPVQDCDCNAGKGPAAGAAPCGPQASGD